MKRTLLPGLSAIILLMYFTSCKNPDNLSISVKDSEDVYKFSAHYDEEKTERVQHLINEGIAPNHIESTEDWDFTTVLNDRTHVKIESAPGDLIIKLDKEENDKASYLQVKRMCEEIKGVLAEKK